MKIWTQFDYKLNQFLQQPRNVFMLVLRLYLAWVFLKSGLLKIQTWESTLELFEFEYAVPLLSPWAAATLATAGEILLPILVIVGLFSRFAVLGLFILNAVAMISYPDISAAGIKDHQLWGMGFFFILLFGAGTFSLDKLISYRYPQLSRELRKELSKELDKT